jgi:hypothetical protein
VVLIRLTAEKGLYLQTVVPGDQPGHGDELVFSLEADQERTGRGGLIAQTEVVEHGAEDVGC